MSFDACINSRCSTVIQVGINYQFFFNSHETMAMSTSEHAEALSPSTITAKGSKDVNLSCENSCEYFTLSFCAPFGNMCTWLSTTDPQTVDYPYPTTNTPPLTTHPPSLFVVHCVACVHVMMIGMQRKMIGTLKFPRQTNLAGNSYTIATILVLRRQKPLTNALDGLYLLCMNRILEARWVGGCGVSLPRRTCVWWKSRQELPSTHDCVKFHHTGGGDIPSIPFL